MAREQGFSKGEITADNQRFVVRKSVTAYNTSGKLTPSFGMGGIIPKRGADREFDG